MGRVTFEKKSCASHSEISVTCTAHKCYDTMLSRFRCIICQVVAYGRLKTKFKVLALKVVPVAYKRWSFTRGSNI